MIEQHHLDEAAIMIATSGWGQQRSTEWHADLNNAVAWHLAGKPQGHGRSSCPYVVKTAQRDAWLDGWAVGQAACLREGIDELLEPHDRGDH